MVLVGVLGAVVEADEHPDPARLAGPVATATAATGRVDLVASGTLAVVAAGVAAAAAVVRRAVGVLVAVLAVLAVRAARPALAADQVVLVEGRTGSTTAASDHERVLFAVGVHDRAGSAAASTVVQAGDRVGAAVAAGAPAPSTDV